MHDLGDCETHIHQTHIHNHYGVQLTKREYAAIVVMQGFAADPNSATGTPQQMAKGAILWADALLAELSKGKKEDENA